ncbi:MAG: putative regulator of Ras-like GTPase activity (Roadblock/LC7/MglB family) [Planctomycetota bacterium]
MKKVLDPLAQVPGVRRAMLISRDGVPITYMTNSDQVSRGDPRPWADSSEDVSAFAGMAASLLSGIERAVDPLSWEAPQRIVMRAARGTLILLRMERATLTVELVRGMAPEDLRLPMESVVARLQRLFPRESSTVTSAPVVEDVEDPPGPLPSENVKPDMRLGLKTPTGNPVPESTTES